MLSNIFAKRKTTEKKHAEVIRSFKDVHVGMAHDEYETVIPVGTRGIATFHENGKVVIILDFKVLPYNKDCVVHTKVGGSEYYNFSYHDKQLI